jgi:O-acetyl-ADP-ribose deacetylase (regulator of RNase III)
MNLGLAKQIRAKYPAVYEDYMIKYRKEGWKVGETQLVHVGDCPRFVANCCTQEFYGRQDRQHVSYKGIRDCLFNVLTFCTREKYSVAMPRIGAGLGGGDWDLILKIIEHESELFPDVLIEIYSLPEATGAKRDLG